MCFMKLEWMGKKTVKLFSSKINLFFCMQLIWNELSHEGKSYCLEISPRQYDLHFQFHFAFEHKRSMCLQPLIIPNSNIYKLLATLSHFYKLLPLPLIHIFRPNLSNIYNTIWECQPCTLSNIWQTVILSFSNIYKL